MDPDDTAIDLDPDLKVLFFIYVLLFGTIQLHIPTSFLTKLY